LADLIGGLPLARRVTEVDGGRGHPVEGEVPGLGDVPAALAQPVGGVLGCTRGLGDVVDPHVGLGGGQDCFLVESVGIEFLAGADDQITPPADAEVIKAGIKGAHLEVIADAAHNLTTERPTEVNAAVEKFLAGLR